MNSPYNNISKKIKQNSKNSKLLLISFLTNILLLLFFKFPFLVILPLLEVHCLLPVVSIIHSMLCITIVNLLGYRAAPTLVTYLRIILVNLLSVLSVLLILLSDSYVIYLLVFIPFICVRFFFSTILFSLDYNILALFSKPLYMSDRASDVQLSGSTFPTITEERYEGLRPGLASYMFQEAHRVFLDRIDSVPAPTPIPVFLSQVVRVNTQDDNVIKYFAFKYRYCEDASVRDFCSRVSRGDPFNTIVVAQNRDRVDIGLKVIFLMKNLGLPRE